MLPETTIGVTGGIEQFDAVEPLHPLTWVPHTSEAWIVRAGGRDWVHKPTMGNNEVLAEAVGLLLGAELDVPVPNGAVLREGNNVSWLSQVVEYVVHWNYDLRASLENGDAMARLYVLDAIIHNEDRHSRNLLLQDVGNGLLRMWSIDTADAGIGFPGELIGSDRPPSPRNHLRPTPLDDETCAAALATAKWCSSVLEPSTVQRVASLACAIAACSDRVKDLEQALIYRCRAAPGIVACYLDLLKR